MSGCGVFCGGGGVPDRGHWGKLQASVVVRGGREDVIPWLRAQRGSLEVGAELQTLIYYLLPTPEPQAAERMARVSSQGNLHSNLAVRLLSRSFIVPGEAGHCNRQQTIYGRNTQVRCYSMISLVSDSIVRY